MQNPKSVSLITVVCRLPQQSKPQIGPFGGYMKDNLLDHLCFHIFAASVSDQYIDCS